VDVTVPAEGVLGAKIKFTYNAFTGLLHYDATAAAPQEVLAVTVQRSAGEKPGGVVAKLLSAGQQTGSGDIQLRSPERGDLAAGKLYVHLYTRGSPLGAARVAIKVPRVLAQN